ncbi:hypothetical protein KJ969_05590 [Patescibacteria group bacterium]|nr:hypothetical protein [Patescibacteria group bacterium]
MLDPLFKKISEETAVWKKKNYLHKDYPAVSEILKFATLEDGSPPLFTPCPDYGLRGILVSKADRKYPTYHRFIQ